MLVPKTALLNMELRGRGQPALTGPQEQLSAALPGPCSGMRSPLYSMSVSSWGPRPSILDEGEGSVLGSGPIRAAGTLSWDLSIRFLSWIQTHRFPQLSNPEPPQPLECGCSIHPWNSGLGLAFCPASELSHQGGSVSGTAVGSGHHTMAMTITEHLLYARLC